MGKFLQFIWEIIRPVVEVVVGIAAWVFTLIWVFTFFGIFIIFAPDQFPTPEWVKYVIIVFDVGCILLILYGAVRRAYEKVYKN
jgi:hypothetical protein